MATYDYTSERDLPITSWNFADVLCLDHELSYTSRQNTLNALMLFLGEYGEVTGETLEEEDHRRQQAQELGYWLFVYDCLNHLPPHESVWRQSFDDGIGEAEFDYMN